MHSPEQRPVFALIDCSSFYCSCERIFRPELRGRPVIVLSNCDGAVIARTEEAKQLGLKMGDPFFKVRRFLEQNDVAVFSSNYALYGELSHRFSLAISSMVSETESYSIDENFALLTGYPEPLRHFARRIQERILQWTGLPTGIGIGHTKTLAKAAQHASKVWRARTGGIVDLREPHAVEWLLKRMPVEEVWGVGSRMKAHLALCGITTAHDLACADPTTMGRKFSIVLERTIRELRGEPCIPLEESPPARQTICTSKMFGSRITTLDGLREAVATYMHRATQKLRAQRSLCGVLRVSIQTSFFGPGPKYAQAVVCTPPYPTDDIRLLTRLALEGLAKIFKEGYQYSKAEVMLMDLRQRGQFTGDLFSGNQSHRTDALMAVVDKINQRWGKDCIRTAAVPGQPDWGMRRELLSPSYMTSFNQLWRVKC